MSATAPLFNWTDTVFMFTGTVFVFIMTPANGFFYSGTVEFKNAMSVIFMCMFTGTVVAVQWFIWGYSLAFSETSKNGFIGDLFHVAWTNLYSYKDTNGVAHANSHPNAPTVPQIVFMLYQLMFASVTPALAFGSIAERTRILPWAVFLFVWCTLVYDVIAYWVWAPLGWLAYWGFKDFAGGLVVHIVSGFSGLAACLVIGKRSSASSMPHNLGHTALGTAFFWFGWFGFNGCSSNAADERGLNAAIVTHLAACFGAITWILFDYRIHRKITSLGFCSGAIAGLVCITPGSGYVKSYYAPIFGIVGALVGNASCFLKARFEYDDSLDAFAVHGAVGFAGLILTGLFADVEVMAMGQLFVAGLPNYQSSGGAVNNVWFQIVIQVVGALVGAIYTFVVTSLIVFAMSKIRIPWFGQSLSLALRMSQEDEITGTDFSLMGEVAYDFTHTGQKHIEAIMA